MSKIIPTSIEYLHFAVDVNIELDNSSCYYEGDIPEAVPTDVMLTRVKLEDIVKNMSASELRQIGLRRITKKSK